MTIGPEPTMQMLSMSVRFGKLVHPGVDEGIGVVRAGTGLGMELDRACAQLRQRQALDRVVVEREVRRVAFVLRAYREPVVLARHEHTAARALEHRVVDAAVAERKLERLVVGG